MQLEKKDAAKSKIEAAKSNKKSANAFAPRHGPAQMCRALSNEMLAIHILYIYVKFCTCRQH
jgi:hypothetical protein